MDSLPLARWSARCHVVDMPKRSSTKPPARDEVQKAYDVIQHVIRQTEGQPEPEEAVKHSAAVMLGRLGGLKGGKARAAKLSPARRKVIAQKAAAARWKHP